MRTLLAILLVPALASAQSRDVASAQAGTATLTGVITVDEQNGGPVRRALVSLTFSNTANQQQTTTDEKGRFTFSYLPAGNARLSASKPSLITTHYGARRPGATFGVPVAITAGQTTTVEMRMPRGAVITGTVFDEEGRPSSGVAVRVNQIVLNALGERSYESISSLGPIPTTDDRGIYRIYGLPPGNFVVSAQPRLLVSGEIRQPTVAELQWAESEIMRASRANAPASADPTPPEPGRTVAYTEVYHPSTVTAVNAGAVTVAQGQERSGVDIRLQLVTTARVSGTITAPDGQPARGASITLIPEVEMQTQDAMRTQVLIETGLLAGARGAVQINPEGAFVVSGVEPGNYTLLARTGAAGRSGGAAGTGSDQQWALTNIRVDGRDIDGIALRLAPGRKISGRVVFESKSAGGAPRTTISIRPNDRRGLSGSSNTGTPAGAPADAFALMGIVPASYRISALATGWTLKSIVANGVDITDAPFEINPNDDLTNVVVTFTDAAAEVTGTVFDGANRPTSDLSIVLFSTDRAKWFAASRWVRPAVRPASDGRFTLSGLAPGEYFLAALTDVSPADLANAGFLDQVAPAALKVTVAAGERKTQDLKIAGR